MRALHVAVDLFIALVVSTAWAGEIQGTASFYGCGDGFHGKRTASGVLFNAYGMTAAHRRLRFGTKVQLYLADKNWHRKGKPVVVTITDRGPAIQSRVIDVSCGVARALGFYRAGTARIVGKIIQ